MMAPLWSDIDDDFASAKRHFERAIELYRHALGEVADAVDYVTAMAFLHAMQAGYTSFETGMRRLLHGLDEPLPVGTDWHAALIRRASRPLTGRRPAIFEVPLVGAIEELRRFRHVAMHSYDDFVPRKAALPVEAAEAFVAGIDAALARFRAAIDPQPDL